MDKVLFAKIEKFVNILRFLRIFPIKFNRTTRRFQNVISSQFYLRLSIQWIYLIFISIQNVRFLIFSNVGITASTMLVFWLMVHILITILPTASIMNVEDLEVYVNYLYDACKTRQSKGLFKKRSPLTAFLVAFGILAALNCVMLTLEYMHRPTAVYYMSTLILPEDPYSSPLWTSAIFIFAFCESYNYICAWGSVLFYTYNNTIFMAVMISQLSSIKSQCTKVNNVDQYKLQSQFNKLVLVGTAYLSLAYPLLLPGHKIIIIFMTIGGSYGVLHLSHIASTHPKVYAFYVVVTLAVFLFQIAWYRLCMDVHKPARAIQSHFIRMDWTKMRPRFQKLIYRNLPIRGGTFHALKQWLPPAFLKKMSTGTMKIHFYIGKNVQAIY